MVNASSGSYVPRHICPLQQSNDTLLDHCLWVVILDPLDLVIPLLERHFSLNRRGITTKGVNSRGTHLHSRHKHAEEVVDICVGPRGDLQTAGQAYLVPILSPWKVTSLLSTLAVLPPPGTPEPLWVTPEEVQPLPPCYLHVENPEHLPELIKAKFPNIPGQV